VSWVNAVSPRFFATYGMTLISGRDFGPADREGAPLVAIVNETFARKFFGEAYPIGREFRGRIGAPGVSTYQVVGVASDAVYRRLREGVVPTLYIPLAQMPADPSITLTVQSAPELRGPLSPVLTRALSAVDGAVALSIRPFDDYVTAASAQERLVAMLASFFGALALLLAGLGLYGVTSYGVSLRRAEIGVRMALGAESGGVVRLVLGRVGWLVSAGVTAGIALAWWASRFISATLLYGVSARDAATFAGAAAVLMSVSAVAAWLPARRAARIHPAEVLRET
jgi:ABC-type antimicrobial peptide transport system permease subunit